MNKNKGFVIPLMIILVAVLTIGGGVYFYNAKKDNSDLESNSQQQVVVGEQKNDEKCKTDDSETAILCELSDAYAYGNNGKTAVIRLQGTLSDYYEKNKQNFNLLINEINNKNRPLEYRIFLIKILSINKDNFSLIRKDLLNIISNKKNADEVRAQMIITSPKIYYGIYHVTRIKDNDDLFKTLISVLDEGNDKLSSAVISSMYGGMADLDEQRAINVVIDFSSDYKNKYKETHSALINALVILKNTKKLTPLTTEAIKYICGKNDVENKTLCQ